MEIWKLSDEKKRKVNDMPTVLGGNSTPYLDAELFLTTKENSDRECTSKKDTRLNT